MLFRLRLFFNAQFHDRLVYLLHRLGRNHFNQVVEVREMRNLALVKPREPAVDRDEKLASLLDLALVAPEPRHVHCRPEFRLLCLLLACLRERALEMGFHFRRITLRAISSSLREQRTRPASWVHSRARQIPSS